MKAVEQDVSFSRIEREILEYWKTHDVFKRSLDSKRAMSPDGSGPASPRKPYIFYDGPPFATGLPHYGHLLAGTIKDVIGRFFTMKGFHVDRRFGWDCHGVPVEFEIQKSLNLHGAKAIKEFGIGNFNEECRKIVLRYTQEWERFVDRSGRWVDFTRQYRTMDLDYMESIWWVLKRLWDRGLVYESLKCVPYSWAINTALSNFEANLNYKDVQDPAITVRAKILGAPHKQLELNEAPKFPVYTYAWTTTPWTLPGNLALAVGVDISYSLVLNPAREEVVIIATNRLAEYFPDLVSSKKSNKVEQKILGEVSGAKLVGLEYQPFFPYFEEYRAKKAFRIYAGDFVSAEDGTGVVHCASFGEDDVQLFLTHEIPVVDPVDEDGNFTELVPDFVGENIKAADPKVISYLKEHGALISHKTIVHSYPFCWRTDTPLMYKPVSSWFVQVEKFRDELVQLNSIIHWVPGHIREGRFGKWLEGARDWAISRNRYWGTPIPFWRCDQCKTCVCLGSVKELETRTGKKITDLHSHFIDHLTFGCESCGGKMQRIPEVLDCWFESGAMPYAQAHYPFEDKDEFERNFPADFIAEGLDQTRGWFYTLLVLSTALFGRPAFRNVIVNGIVLAEDGKKMSKSLKNYPPPDEVMEEFGADAMRLYLLSSAATRAEDLRFSKNGVREVVRQTILPLWNAYNFLVTYARVDNWTPDKIPTTPSSNLLDRWILSRVASLAEGVDSALSSYHLYAATQPILDFVDQLTNWFIRLNRRRFWAGSAVAEQEDKLHAYATLHRALSSFVRILAPLAPFVTEEIYLNLSGARERNPGASVHLTAFPSAAELKGVDIDTKLERAMELFEEVILLGRSVRNALEIKVRQPLSKLTVVHPNAAVLDELQVLDDYIREELNVKSVDYSSDEGKFVNLSAQLNTKLLGKILGPKLGSSGMSELRTKVENLTTTEIREFEQGGKFAFRDIELGLEDIIINRATKPGLSNVATSGRVSVVLDTTITPELRLEGLAREFVNRVQKLRKDSGFEVQDRIILNFMTACPQLTMAVEEHYDYIARETLAVEVTEVRDQNDLTPGGTSASLPTAQDIGGKVVILSLQRIQA